MLIAITDDYIPFSDASHEEVLFNVSYSQVVFGIPESFGGELEARNNYTESAQDLDCFAW